MAQREEAARFFIADDATAAQFPARNGVRVGVLNAAANVAATNSVTIGTTVYTFVLAPAVPFDVDIGGDAATSLNNLKAAINLESGAGSKYGTGTTLHPFAVAETVNTTADTLKITAPPGVAAGYALVKDGANLSWTDPAGTVITSMAQWVGLGTSTAAHAVWAATGIAGGTLVSMWMSDPALDALATVSNAAGQVLFGLKLQVTGSGESRVSPLAVGGVFVDGGFGVVLDQETVDVGVAYHLMQ